MSKLLSWMKKSPRKTEDWPVLPGKSLSPGKFGLFTRSSRFNPQTCRDCLKEASLDLLGLLPQAADKIKLEIKIASYLSDNKEDLARITLLDFLELEYQTTAIAHLSQYCRRLADRITSASEANMDIPEPLKETVACLCFAADQSNVLPLEKVKGQLILQYGQDRISSVVSSHTTEKMKSLFAIPNPSEEHCHLCFSVLSQRHDKIWLPATLKGEKLEQQLKIIVEQIASIRAIQSTKTCYSNLC